MIKINKTQPAPRILYSRGTRRGQDKCHIETQKVCRYFESQNCNPNEECEYSFDGGIYGNRIWKEQLLEDQHNKCCFCESNFRHVSPGDVEHFRPKGGYQQFHHEPIQKPGYYWLAYDWENLLIACENCNRSEKKNLFPLLEPEKRATKENKDIIAEKPVLINPWKENPDDFIKFNFEVPIGIDSDGRGQETIELLKLDENEHLATMRRDKLSRIETLIKLIEIEMCVQECSNTERSIELIELINKIKGIYEETELSEQIDTVLNALHDKSEYAGMARSNFKDKIEELCERYQMLTAQ